MTDGKRVDELAALKEIAVTLNITNDTNHMLDAVLRKLLEVTGLTTGWIFLMEKEPGFTCVVDHRLPPALSWGEKEPMCTGSCWCVDKYWGGRLHNAVNIINCKRIENAIEYKWGDTEGIYHHATVPLKAGEEWFGLLNVAAPGKEHFSDEELALLTAVAYQIGTALKRTKLFHAEQKRAELYAKLGDASKAIGAVTELQKIPCTAVQQIGKHFPWAAAAFFLKEGKAMSLRALYQGESVKSEWKAVTAAESGPVAEAMKKGKVRRVEAEADQELSLPAAGIAPFRSAAAVPIRLRGQTPACLLVTSQKASDFDETDLEVLQSLADHISISMENARLNQQRRELSKLEERNRLARDLHDSVCQNLFSLSLMTRGMEGILDGEQDDLMHNSLREIQRLTEDSLKEMRALIWQLRPAGLEEGLLTALKLYGQKLGIIVRDQLDGFNELPRAIEETLLRIGQESLNNVAKHAKVTEVQVYLKVTKREVLLRVSDGGAGFSQQAGQKLNSLGLISMRERAEMLGGLFSIESKPGKGTVVQVLIPTCW
ncbi:GAF domain-containing sensor histidine kinase [Brevibacillus fluminis]|uniref:GAF domain-containing sensor histidine kinase n=1 Tax=Brevibacillus fluminis TaxID=511487 RepID=UPI003F8A0FCF